MQFRATALLVALAAFSSLLFALQPRAEACSVAYMPYSYEIEQNNTPDCVEVRGQTGYEDEETPQLFIDNSCAHPVDFDKLECESCESKREVAAETTGTLDLVRRDMEIGDSTTQTYAWTVDDREGLVETTVTRQEGTPENTSCSQPQPAGPLGQGHACAAPASVTGTSDGPLSLGAMLTMLLGGFAAMRFRARD